MIAHLDCAMGLLALDSTEVAVLVYYGYRQ